MTADHIHSLFRSHFGGEPDVIATAPGRVNLIGEHTDYNEGFVFPAAIDRGLLVAAEAVDGPTDLFSAQMGAGQPFEANSVILAEVKGWAGYAAGMAWAMRLPEIPLPNIRAVVDSSIPIGSGVSSSAAIEVAFGTVWNELAGLQMPPDELARRAQKCENEYVGVACGIMDQMASAMGREGHAMFLDTRTLKIDYAPIPDGLVVVLCDTGKPRALTESAYNERRGQCEQASRALDVPMLRDADLEGLERARGGMSETVYRRARHVVTENARCLGFRDALERGDLETLDRLMRESHVSLRDDYEVSSPELDAMAEAAWEAPGCVGARMTGAGFGGACVALVREEAVDAFGESLRAGYLDRTGLAGEAIACRVVDGSKVLGRRNER
jgi:galactokinase